LLAAGDLKLNHHALRGPFIPDALVPGPIRVAKPPSKHMSAARNRLDLHQF
jgi:hypothetical protein